MTPEGVKRYFQSMTRLILMIVLGIVAMAYFPESREVLVKATEPVITPPLRWHTSHELERIVRELRLYEGEHMGELPEARRFPDWLVSTLDFGAATDPWGSRYVLYERRDSFAVVSFGPDQLPETADDLRVAAVKARARRR